MTWPVRSMTVITATKPSACSAAGDDIRVKVRYTADERSRRSDIEQIRIRDPGWF